MWTLAPPRDRDARRSANSDRDMSAALFRPFCRMRTTVRPLPAPDDLCRGVKVRAASTGQSVTSFLEHLLRAVLLP